MDTRKPLQVARAPHNFDGNLHAPSSGWPGDMSNHWPVFRRQRTANHDSTGRSNQWEAPHFHDPLNFRGEGEPSEERSSNFERIAEWVNCPRQDDYHLCRRGRHLDNRLGPIRAGIADHPAGRSCEPYR